MKLTDKIARLDSLNPFYTFEFFPPRTEQGFVNLVSRIERLSNLKPIAVNITWGAGGSTKDWSLKLASICQNDHEVETVLHLTCTNMHIGMVDEALRAAKEQGIQNILALRGDPPRGEEYWIPTDPRFTSAADLVRYIKTTAEYRDYFCVGVAAYPDGHAESSDDMETQIKHLKAKVDAGADFIVSQLFYDVDGFLNWQRKVYASGIRLLIIAGIMPMQTYASFMRLTKLCGLRIPDSLMEQVNRIKHDDQQVKELGVEVAVSMIRKLTDEGVQGFHFCTLNLEKSVQRVLEKLEWVGHRARVPNMLISDSPVKPSSLPPELVITAADASFNAKATLHQHHPNSDSSLAAGKGEMNDRTTWDEFPNGRFGDSKSPAYGANELWDNGLGVSQQEAIKNWGNPKEVADITTLFLRYLNGETPSTPWSDAPLSAETDSIKHRLIQLNSKGWWTVGSQPAIDAVPSGDETYGWGPTGGYVFQKAFVEFFCNKDDVAMLEARIKSKGGAWLTYFASNMVDDFITNMVEEGTNAVTWGVFPGKEIISPTIIERDSFLAWKDEAFGYWTQWGLFYPPDSPERKLLETVRDERWLISIVHHNFKDQEALWTYLLSDD